MIIAYFCVDHKAGNQSHKNEKLRTGQLKTLNSIC